MLVSVRFSVSLRVSPAISALGMGSVLLLVLCGCGGAPEATTSSNSVIPLREVFEDDFEIGVALGRRQISEERAAETALIAEHFSSVTPENAMKWANIHPEPMVFDFALAEQLLATAQKNGQQVIGHTLIWHSQIPEWAFEYKDGSMIDDTTLFARMEHHINNVAGRFKGRIAGWDVVNEALNDDGSFRQSEFYEIAGDEYLYRAFQYAEQVDPMMELYYNDYSLFRQEKVDAAIRLAQSIRQRGLRIDGIGMQGHWGMERPSAELIEQSILKIHAAGLKVMITELDIDVLPYRQPIEGADVDKELSADPSLDPFIDGLPDSVATKQASRYEDIFRLLYKHRDKITRVTFWGLHDGDSWKNNWPIRGRTNHCLLFDRELQPKPAYWSILEVKSDKQ